MFAMSSMSSSWKDISIDPDRLEWFPDDRRKLENGGTLLGEGTFGSVYRGEMDGDVVAIKVIKAPAGQPNERVSAGRKAAEEQHAREIRRLMELRFRHVVQCYGVSPARDSRELLIITECLNGGSLHGSLERARKADVPVTDTSFLTICSHVAKGLRYIHNRYIHGDMKPHNVLLNVGIIVDQEKSAAYFPHHVEAKVADFGMSKRLKSDDTFSLAMSTVEFGNQPFGTYAYMAPESFHGVRDLDDNALKAVDVFAFGVLAYEILSGMSPWKFEGVASPMQLQRLVVFEKRRPSWGKRVIREEFRQLVERCWHDDSRARPTAKELSIQFGYWLKEARQRDASQSSSLNPSSSTSSVSSSLSSAANGSARMAPPRLPIAPTIIRHDNEPSEFVRVQSSEVPYEELRSHGRPPYGDGNDAPALPTTPSPDPISVEAIIAERETRREDEGYADDGSERGDDRSDSGNSSLSGSGRNSDSRGDGSGRAASESMRSSRSSEDEEVLEKRRNYWEKRGPSVKHSVPIQSAASGYEIGDSVANQVGVDAEAPENPTGAPTLSLPQADANSLEYTMAGIEITRVETQILKEPERPELNLPMNLPMNLPSEDIFNTGDEAAKGDTLWGNSMLEAVTNQNNAGVGTGVAAQPQAVGGMVEKFEALSKQDVLADDASSQRLASHGRSVSSPLSEQVAAMAAMGMDVPGHRRTASSPSEGNADVNPDNSPNTNMYTTAESAQTIAQSSLNPNGHVSPPTAGFSLSAKSAVHHPLPSYGAPARQQTLPAPQSLSMPGQQQSGVNGQLLQSAYSNQAGQAAGASTFPNLATHTQPQRLQQLSIGDVLQALQAPDGVTRVLKWWEDGHAVVIASAMAREDQRVAGAPRLKILVSLLQKVTASQSQVKSATNASVARDLCIALGNVSRGGSIDRQAAELALPATLTTMQAFTYDMNVYSAACYALANVLKVSNDIANDRVRTDVADWISHATSFNLNNQRGGPQPTLAYTTAAAARNFIWRKVSNANAFFTRRRAKTAVHPSAAENMCKSMLFFQRDPTVVEACLSAYAALAFFASHRISLIKIGVVSAVARVMDRPTNQQNAALLTMGLATLGIIVAREATTAETSQIVDAFVKEGGVRCVVKVLGDAVRARNSRVMEEGLYALTSIARFDERLGKTVVQTGGVSYVIQAVFCNVEAAPELVTVRSAEVMCDVVDVLSQHAAAASAMRQTGLSAPLQTLVSRFSTEPKVTNPGRQAIARVR